MGSKIVVPRENMKEKDYIVDSVNSELCNNTNEYNPTIKVHPMETRLSKKNLQKLQHELTENVKMKKTTFKTVRLPRGFSVQVEVVNDNDSDGYAKIRPL
tara:strand:+ start:144 stop:443 length:300 start_codon:yes stop_codon:yes gene_type:complete